MPDGSSATKTGSSGDKAGRTSDGASDGGTGGSAQAGGSVPDAGSVGGTAGSGGDDPEGAFDKSLGDFDGEIARERESVASAGKGSGRSAQGRESGDAGVVKTASGAGRTSRGEIEDAGPGGAAGEQADAGGEQQSGSGAENAGAGQPDAAGGGSEGTGGKGTEQQGAPAADIPDDIPADGTGEDQVARQLREAAMAEKDPVVREALWEQYRRHTGIRK